jgi:hypothetical protein
MLRSWGGLMLLCACATEVHALDVSVFGDASLVDSNAPGVAPRFQIGSLDLYALEHIDDKTKALFETLLELSGETQDANVDIERFFITREVNDRLDIGLGRLHSPLGYWNMHYHHGILLQDTVTRPFFLAFEDEPNAILPMHVVGVMAEGEVAGGFSYEAGVANSDSINSSEPGVPSSSSISTSVPGGRLQVPNRIDLSSGKTLFGRMGYEIEDRPFKPGVSFMVNDVLDSSPALSSSLVGRGRPLVKQAVIGANVRYESEPFRFLGEFYWLRNDAQAGVGDGRTHTAIAWFAQFSYRFTEPFEATYRYEALDFDNKPGNQDPYFMSPRLLARGNIGTDRRNVACLRYDFSESNALMLEVSRTNPQLADGVTTTILSWAFVMY